MVITSIKMTKTARYGISANSNDNSIEKNEITKEYREIAIKNRPKLNTLTTDDAFLLFVTVFFKVCNKHKLQPFSGLFP